MITSEPLSLKVQGWWLFGLLVLVPFSLTYITERPFALSYLNVLSVIFILLGGANLLLGYLKGSLPRQRSFWGVVGLLFLAMAFALLFTHPLRAGIGFWISRLSQPFLVGLFSYQLLAARRVRVEQIVQALFLSLIPLVIGGLLQLGHVLPYHDPGRITVLYQYPNTFARYVEIILTLSLPWLLLGQEKLRAWQLVLWAAGFCLLLGTESYNGIVTLVLSLGITFLFLPGQYRRLQLRIYPVAVAVVGIVLLNVRHLPKWQTSITDSRLTRLEFWHIAGATIRHHFLTGIGIKGWETQYGHLVLLYGKLPPLNWLSQQPHDVFLDSLLKAGLLGLVAVVSLMLWPIIRGWQLSRRPLTAGGWFGFSMLAYGLAMLLFGIIDDPLWSDDTIPLLFILYFALAYVWAQSRKEPS